MHSMQGLEEMVQAASELLDACQRLEAGIGGQLDRECIRGRLAPLDEGQAFRLALAGEITLYAAQSEKVDLGRGALNSDIALIAAARWGIAQIVRGATLGHVRVEVDDAVRAVGADPYGDALVRIAGRLAQGPPIRRHRRCDRCGKDITHQRSTRRYCGNACKQAMVRARRRAREEDAR